MRRAPTVAALAACLLLCLASSPSASAQAPTVIPIVDCVATAVDPPGSRMAFFGYHNTGTNAVVRSYGSQNRMTPGEEILPGQPFLFLPGRKSYVWSAPFAPAFTQGLTWVLSQVEARAGLASPPCRNEPPRVDGEARVGRSLSAVAGALVDDPAPTTPGTVTFSWQVERDGSWVPVSTGTTYTPGVDDIDRRIRVVQRRTGVNAFSLVFESVSPARRVLPDLLRPVVRCVAAEGDGRRAFLGTVNDDGAVLGEPVGPGNRFSSGAEDRGQPVSFPVGPTPESFSVRAASGEAPDLGWTLRGVTARFADAPPCTRALAPPVALGNALVGSVLSAGDGVWDDRRPVGRSAAWQRSDGAGGWVDVASGPAYAVSAADLGARIRRVERSTLADLPPSAVPGTPDVVEAAGPPTPVVDAAATSPGPPAGSNAVARSAPVLTVRSARGRRLGGALVVDRRATTLVLRAANATALSARLQGASFARGSRLGARRVRSATRSLAVRGAQARLVVRLGARALRRGRTAVLRLTAAGPGGRDAVALVLRAPRR